ncbi:MAG: 23S rRNA (guanosine(2251)-2'-O)-methyltransferase RlmB [Vicinamibacterales bacterium]
MIVYGLNPVIEALRAGRVKVVRIANLRRNRRADEIKSLALAGGVPVIPVSPETLDLEAHGASHQGVVAEVTEAEARTLEEVLAEARPRPALMVVLDGVEDPQNVGAILRAADAAGVDAVVRQSRHSAALGASVAKASAGALAHVRIVTVVNVARAIDALREAGIWTVGLDQAGEVPYDEVALTLPTALVLGAEGRGLRRLVRERCEVTAYIPMLGHVASLNVAVAGGIVLFEALRQRRKAGG